MRFSLCDGCMIAKNKNKTVKKCREIEGFRQNPKIIYHKKYLLRALLGLVAATTTS